MTEPDLVLHGYWRSGAAWRIRIALGLKGLSYRQVAHDLRRGDQRDAAFLALNPQGLVPALEVDGALLTQSPAILEWLEERYPAPPLLPKAADARATVRAMMALVCCDIHPLNNLRVLTALRTDLGASEDQVFAWITRWIAEGFAALETHVTRRGGVFCWGDAPTLADCCLVPQVGSAQRFGVDLSPYPAIMRVAESCRALPAFAAAEPPEQPDAD